MALTKTGSLKGIKTTKARRKNNAPPIYRTTLQQQNSIDPTPGNCYICFCSMTGQPVMCGIAEPPQDVFHGNDVLPGQWVFTIKQIYQPDYPAPDYLIDKLYFHECEDDFVLWHTKSINTCVKHNILEEETATLSIPMATSDMIEDVVNNNRREKKSAWSFDPPKIELLKSKEWSKVENVTLLHFTCPYCKATPKHSKSAGNITTHLTRDCKVLNKLEAANQMTLDQYVP